MPKTSIISLITLLSRAQVRGAEKLLAAQFPESMQRPWANATIVAANDTLGHSAVLAAYDAAIALAKLEAR